MLYFDTTPASAPTMGSTDHPVTPLPRAPALAGPVATPAVLPSTPTSITSPSHTARGLSADLSAIPNQPGSAAVLDPSTDLSHRASITHAFQRASPVPLSPKAVLSPRFSPMPLTGAEAMAAERRSRASHPSKEAESARGQSPNPAVHAIETLLGQGQGMSKPHDAPRATTSMSEGVAVAAQAMSLPEQPAPSSMSAMSGVVPAPPLEAAVSHPSPLSTSSLASLGGSAPTVTAEAPRTPADLVEAPRDVRAQSGHAVASLSESPKGADDRRSNRSFTFPGPLMGVGAGGEGAQQLPRGMSLPMPNSGPHGQRSSSSSSSKKHKCPYCSTDFTRHHNLKSHLLTHSHEKPFICSTCQARFRRLHDLKRHTKLHTGERPHICPRCGRRFARGDALARHNKGQGGCAGRPGSVGSFAGEGEDESMQDADLVGEDDHMEGLTHAGDDQRLEEGSPPTTSPSGAPSTAAERNRAARAAPGAHGGYHAPAPHPSTYPPPGPRRDLGSLSARRLQPSLPGADPTRPPRFSGGLPAGSTGSSSAAGGGVGSILPHAGMTESPAPLSPGNAATGALRRADSTGSRRPRSPSLTQQLQQRHFARQGSARSPPQPALPPPLPSFPGMGHAEPKYSVGPGGTSTAASRGAPVDAAPPPSGSFSSQLSPAPAMPSPLSRSTAALPPESSPSSNEGILNRVRGDGSGNGSASRRGQGSMPAPPDDHLWHYVRSLESRLNQLTEEVTGLRHQLDTTTAKARGEPHRGSGPGPGPGPGGGGGGGGSNNGSTNRGVS